jgi:hypothetical protein
MIKETSYTFHKDELLVFSAGLALLEEKLRDFNKIPFNPYLNKTVLTELEDVVRLKNKIDGELEK